MEERTAYILENKYIIGCFRTLRNTACSRKRQVRIEMRDDGTTFPILRKTEKRRRKKRGKQGVMRKKEALQSVIYKE